MFMYFAFPTCIMFMFEYLLWIQIVDVLRALYYLCYENIIPDCFIREYQSNYHLLSALLEYACVLSIRDRVLICKIESTIYLASCCHTILAYIMLLSCQHVWLYQICIGLVTNNYLLLSKTVTKRSGWWQYTMGYVHFTL